MPSLPKRKPKGKIAVTNQDRWQIIAWCVVGLCLGLLIAAIVAMETVTIWIAGAALLVTLYFIWDEWFRKK